MTLGDDGTWGPVGVNGQQSYELLVVRAGFPDHHFYFQPWLRSSSLVRMNVAPPNSAIVANTNVGDDHMAAVIVRQKEWWTTHPTGQDDVLTIGTSGATLRRSARGRCPHERDEQRGHRDPRARRGSDSS